MTTIGYIRVSTGRQTVESQRLAIYDAGFRPDEWVEVVMSSRRSKKVPEVEPLLERLKPGDKIVVSELSRLGRSISQVIIIADEIRKAGAELHCIKENIHLKGGKSDIQSKVMVTMFSLFAEIERDLISERTKEGLSRARADGKILGRPKGNGPHDLDKHRDQIEKWLKKGLTGSAIAKLLDRPQTSVSYYIRTRGLK